MSSVVGRNLVDVRVTLAVTTRIPSGSGLVGVDRDAAGPPIQRVSRVALERRRQAGADQPCPGDRPLAVPAPQRVGRLDGRPLARVRRSRTATAARAHPGSMPSTPSSRTRIPRISGRASSMRGRVDRLGHVGRLGERSLARDRLEAAVADLDRDGPGPNPGRPEPAGDAFGHREQRPLDHLRVAGVDVERVLVTDRLGRVAVVDRIGIDPARPSDERRRRASRTAAR